ncbi:MAG: aminotransferase class V-fold PLP-dependent enzyme [Euryarchaeota archaeon]|jgi:glutamate/tyrosine decarboxylase-like PLP-dependent enzyme|nr:aminotransferase class V-fold PLP-dependent enzyme [Euryarchaeota archaeon]
MDVVDFIDALSSRVVNYLDSANSPGKVVDYLPAKSLSKTTDIKLPLEGRGLDSVLDDIDNYLRACVKTNRAEFMNPLWGGVSLAGLAGEIIANLSNTSMYTYELAPLATLIEQTIISRVGEIIGFPQSGGSLTTGGSNGNMLGILCARQAMIPTSTHSGFDGRDMVIFVSEEAHYSVLMAANVLGIGHRNVIKVSCDDEGRMKPSSLEDEIIFAKKEGRTPFCVVATAGTTVRGAFDPIRELADIAHREGLWYHIDAAWGGSCLFSNELNSLMSGCELADSICWDAHKMLGMPLICSLFIVKDKSILGRVCAHGESAHYLFHSDTEEVDLGRYSLQCGRRNDALKLWLAWREKGDAGWAKIVENYFSLANHLEQRVNQEASLTMMSTRQWTNVCFRFDPQQEDVDLNALNAEIRDRIMKGGKFMFSRANIGDDVILRLVISNPKVTEQSLDALADEIITIGYEIINNIPV